MIIIIAILLLLLIISMFFVKNLSIRVEELEMEKSKLLWDNITLRTSLMEVKDLLSHIKDNGKSYILKINRPHPRYVKSIAEPLEESQFTYKKEEAQKFNNPEWLKLRMKSYPINDYEIIKIKGDEDD